MFCPTFAELKNPCCEKFTGATVAVVAVGTNNLSQENRNPSMLAKDMSHYIHSVIRQHPIFAENSSINTRGNLVKELRTVTGRLPVGYRSVTGHLTVGYRSVNGRLPVT